MTRAEYHRIMYKRMQGKGYEAWCISTILADLREKYPDLKYVTQQCVEWDNNTRYLMDLYFPQLNVSVEIDEAQHNAEDYKEADKTRTKRIAQTIGCEEYRIPIFNESEARDVSEIEESIADVIRKIEEKIKTSAPLHWLTYEEELALKKKSGMFDVKDAVTYNKIAHIFDLCGTDFKATQRSFYYRKNKKYSFWIPPLTPSPMSPAGQNKILDFYNWFNDDLTELYERKKDVDDYQWVQGKDDGPRIVFMKQKNEFGEVSRKFVGVFEPATHSGSTRTYRKAATQITFEEANKPV